MSLDDEIRHIPGIWFHKAGGSIIPVPPIAFFDDVPDDLEFGLGAVYPFTQTDVLRKLVKLHPEILDYLQEHPIPSGSMKRCLEWASPIGAILLRSDYSLLYCNHLTTCHTDEVELKRTIAGLPEKIINYWPKDFQIEVCLGNDLDVRPVARTWAELTMSHLTSGQRFAFSLPPALPREPAEPTVHFGAEEEAEPTGPSGTKSAMQCALDEITAGLTAKQEPLFNAPRATPSPRTSQPPPSPPSPPLASPLRLTINPIKVALILVGIIVCALLVAINWQKGSEREKGQRADAKSKNSKNDVMSKLASMTSEEAYTFGFQEVQPQFEQALASVKSEAYPNSETNQIRRRNGDVELTPDNADRVMRKLVSSLPTDEDFKTSVRQDAAKAGISSAVIESYLRGAEAGAEVLKRGGVPVPSYETAPATATSKPSPSANTLGEVRTAKQAPVTETPNPLSDHGSTRERSPLGDLVVWHSREQSGEGQIWLDCADDSRRTAQLCDYDARSGQVSFSPDESWIVVTDGGGPGSSLGTELRAFRREYENVYTEVPDAGVANKAAEAVLRRRHVPESVELAHVYAQVDGWSEDGTKLKFRVWADDGRQPGYRLEPTAVTYDVTALQGRQPAVSPASSQTQDDTPPLSQPHDYSTMQADRNHADAELNDIYKRLMNALDPTQQEQLRVGERTWIKARDAQADALARGSTASGSDYQANDLRTLTELTRKRTQALTAMLENIRTASSAGLQKRLPNGAVADPYANYTSVHPPVTQTPRQPSAALSRVYTVPELKSLAGTRPIGAGLRGDFVLVKRENNQVLLQSRPELRNFGIRLSTNGRDAIYRGNTFVSVNCSRDMSRFISGQLVTIPAEQPLRIISVSQNSQGQVDVEASF